MVVGWIGHRREDDSVQMAFGYSMAFAAVGAALALLNWRLRGRSPDAEPGAASDRPVPQVAHLDS
jgi:hypothetical protein